ncbi:MAG TPA: lytic murein transglycosylase B, partial [Gammaproteobacteria bacterium]|nr:lytic murein transglycosylase B [Gammaproteobacteria bacterium]
MIRYAALALLAALAGPVAADITDRPGVRDFIERMHAQHGFEKAALEAVFQDVEIQQDIIEAISRPAESLPWHRYRPIFVTESRTEEGVAFWEANAELLAEAEERYGVDPAVVVAILGVETRYGAHKGGHRVVDALSTLAFAYPPRADFFRSELEQYLLMAREEGFEPGTRHGSYAGAMGKPQFIASSFRSFAVDFDGDGRRDLWNGTADAIGSVAHYLKVHDWQPGDPIASRATALPEAPGDLADKGFKPWASVAH